MTQSLFTFLVYSKTLLVALPVFDKGLLDICKPPGGTRTIYEDEGCEKHDDNGEQ